MNIKFFKFIFYRYQQIILAWSHEHPPAVTIDKSVHGYCCYTPARSYLYVRSKQ